MKKIFTILTICFLSFSFSSVTAQWVTLSDSSFTHWLGENGYAGCVNGDKIDTTCQKILDTDSLTIPYSCCGWYYLTGIKYFKNLQTLKIEADITNLSSTVLPPNLKTLDVNCHWGYYIPQLPTSLTTLIAGGSNLYTLPDLPSGLKVLICYGYLVGHPVFPDGLTILSYNSQVSQDFSSLPSALIDFSFYNSNNVTLPSLPSSLVRLNIMGGDYKQNGGISQLPDLPSSLRYLRCKYTYLTDLPALPSSLDTLDVQNNRLEQIPQLPLSLSYFDCSNNNLASLPAFPNSLKKLYCSYNSLIALSDLPALTDFDCFHNLLTSLPAIPTSLNYLYCWDNSLSSLPALHDSLLDIYCNDNLLTSLPTLPLHLEELDCWNNLLASLPTLPNSLLYLYCANNLISSLPALPNALYDLECYKNVLTGLPKLPDSLYYLNCADNLIATLPAIPNNVYEFNCTNNLLTNLPELPSTISILICDSNQLSSLPSLPDSIEMLRCSYNVNLKCLPSFKKLISTGYSRIYPFSIEGTGIKCLPNAIEHPNFPSMPAIDTMPVCDVFSKNGCELGWNIKGKIFKDDDNDCLQMGSERNIFPVKVNLYEASNVVQSGYFPSKEYSFKTELSSYKIEVDTTNGFPFYTSCPSSGDTTISVTVSDSIFSHIDFGMKCKTISSSFDIGAWAVNRAGGSFSRFFPGDTIKISINAGDLNQAMFGSFCYANTISGQVKVVIKGPAKYVDALTGAKNPTANGDTLIYSIPDFSLVNSQTDFAFRVVTNTTAQIGEQVCFDVFVTPATGDNSLYNNYLTHCFAVRNSFDPNEKEVSPIGSLPYPYEDWLTYTIHFQNTGNDSARHIRILDTLDSNIDARTFQLLSYSVAPTVQIKGSEVIFSFPNIYLPDSTSDKEGSKGYVSYKVKPIANLPSGMAINNSASIYFDFNSPVVTNTTTNQIAFPTSIIQNELNTSITIYPNPTKEKLFVTGHSLSGNIEVKNLLGQTMILKNISSSINKMEINVTALTNGIYFIHFHSSNGNTVKKFVKD